MHSCPSVSYFRPAVSAHSSRLQSAHSPAPVRCPPPLSPSFGPVVFVLDSLNNWPTGKDSVGRDTEDLFQVKRACTGMAGHSKVRGPAPSLYHHGATTAATPLLAWERRTPSHNGGSQGAIAPSRDWHWLDACPCPEASPAHKNTGKKAGSAPHCPRGSAFATLTSHQKAPLTTRFTQKSYLGAIAASTRYFSYVGVLTNKAPNMSPAPPATPEDIGAPPSAPWPPAGS